MSRFLIFKRTLWTILRGRRRHPVRRMMSWSICSGCQTAADLPSVFTFLSPLLFSLSLSLPMQADCHSEHAPPAPPHPHSHSPSPHPTPFLNEPPLPLRCFSHALQAAAGPQRRAWYTLCCETKNPMQLKSERALGCKDSPGWRVLFYRQTVGHPLF